MGKCSRRVIAFAVVLAGVVAGSACNKYKTDEAVGQGSGPPPGIFGGPGRKQGPIGEIMVKLFKGPQSLKDSIARGLNNESPPWATIQPQTKELSQLAASVSKYDPPKGSKESWAKMTGSLSESAAALDRAAQAKNKDDAQASLTVLSQSCMACHRQHRGGPGGFQPPGK